MALSGKSVLITGGSGGVGADMAVVFAEAGARVTLAARRHDRLNAVAGSHPNIHSKVADVTKPNSVDSLFSESRHDIVIANAGIASSSPFRSISLEDWNAIIATNLTGTFLTLRAGFRQMPNDGRLIAVASILAVSGSAYTAAYSASKHGVLGLVRSVAKEVGDSGVTVNAICPGYLETEMTDQTLANIRQKTGMSREDAIRALVGRKPDGRLIPPRRVSETALWLASDAASEVNGQAIVLSGGEI